jgi:hypothetical protein
METKKPYTVKISATVQTCIDVLADDEKDANERAREVFVDRIGAFANFEITDTEAYQRGETYEN